MSAHAVLNNQRGNLSSSFILPCLFLLGVAFSILLAAIGLQAETQVPTVDRFGSLPLSQHALTAHASEKWNATSIAKFFDEGGCTPSEYLCAAEDFRVAYCQVNGRKSIGLLIGITTRQIITGFMGDTATVWSNRCKGKK